MAQPRPPGDTGASDLVVAEYSALREEILKRSELQHQLLALTAAATGAFWAIKTPSILFLHPILVMFLALAWTNHNVWILRAAVYIRTYVEEQHREIRWEHHLDEQRRTAGWWSSDRVFAAVGGMFLVTETVTLLLGVSLLSDRPSYVEASALLAGVLASLVTLVAMLETTRSRVGD
jgi:hypothetical protein